MGAHKAEKPGAFEGMTDEQIKVQKSIMALKIILDKQDPIQEATITKIKEHGHRNSQETILVQQEAAKFALLRKEMN